MRRFVWFVLRLLLLVGLAGVVLDARADCGSEACESYCAGGTCNCELRQDATHYFWVALRIPDGAQIGGFTYTCGDDSPCAANPAGSACTIWCAAHPDDPACDGGGPTNP